MNYLKPGLILVLFATAMASSMLAWRQHHELVALRTMRGPAGSADSTARIRELERLNAQLRAAPRPSGSSSEPAEATAPAERPASREGGFARGGRGQRGPGLMRELETNPEVQALRAVQQKAQLDQRYAGLFQQLDLSPEKLEQFKTLLAERQATAMDVMSAAREQGIDPRRNADPFRQLMATAQGAVADDIKALIGDAAYAEYQAYEQTAAERNTVSQLERRLSYSDTPLTPAQASQLVQILASASPASTAATNADFPMPAMGGRGGRGGPGSGESAAAPITPEAVAQASAVLSAAQVNALQQLQQQQQARQQLRQMVGGPPGGRGSRSTPTGG
jgi:hypothetical protein